MVNHGIFHCMLVALFGLLQGQQASAEPVSYYDLKPEGNSVLYDPEQAAKLRVFYKERMLLKKGHHHVLDPISAHRLQGTSPDNNPDKTSSKPSMEDRDNDGAHGQKLQQQVGNEKPKHPNHERETTHLHEGHRDSDDRDEGREGHRDSQSGNVRRLGNRHDKDHNTERLREEHHEEPEGHTQHDDFDKDEFAYMFEG